MNRWEAFTKIIAALPPSHRAGVVKLAIVMATIGVTAAPIAAAIKFLG